MRKRKSNKVSLDERPKNNLIFVAKCSHVTSSLFVISHSHSNMHRIAQTQTKTDTHYFINGVVLKVSVDDEVFSGVFFAQQDFVNVVIWKFNTFGMDSGEINWIAGWIRQFFLFCFFPSISHEYSGRHGRFVRWLLFYSSEPINWKFFARNSKRQLWVCEFLREEYKTIVILMSYRRNGLSKIERKSMQELFKKSC